MMKLGIMGGTFNPIHFGHLFLAENAYEQIGLDQILFMPSKNPPHKAKPTQVTDQQRVEMIALAIGDIPILHYQPWNGNARPIPIHGYPDFAEEGESEANIIYCWRGFPIHDATMVSTTDHFFFMYCGCGGTG
jgi:cytidyltransferase-like protein